MHLHSLDDMVMDTERRKAARKRLNQLAYIRIGADNGGLISDLGPGGLGFQTIASIDNEGPLRFWFTLDSDDRVQATGQLVWTDESRKVGGLRFTQISKEALDVIQDWIEREEVQPGERPETHEEVKVEAPIERPLEPPAAPRQLSRDPLRFSTPPRRSHQPAAVPVASSPKPEPAVARAPQTPPRPPAPRPDPLRVMATPQHWSPPVLSEPPRGMVSPEMVRGFTTGLTILAVVMTALALGFGYRRELGRSLVNLGERLTGESPLADTAPASDPTDDPPADAAPSGSAPADANPTNATSTYTIPSKPASTNEFKPLPPPAGSSAAAKPVSTAIEDGTGAGARAATPQPKPPAETQPASQPPAATPSPAASNRSPSSTSAAGFQNLSASKGSAADSGELELETGRQFLEAPTGQRKSTEAAKWLWMSVEKGNPKAEVLLADLFLHGDGVTKNCAQARILLGAAIKHGDTEAIPKLHALDRGGCR